MGMDADDKPKGKSLKVKVKVKLKIPATLSKKSSFSKKGGMK